MEPAGQRVVDSLAQKLVFAESIGVEDLDLGDSAIVARLDHDLDAVDHQRRRARGNRPLVADVEKATGWAHRQTGFSAGVNEAAMLLGGDSRGADGAIWRRADTGPDTGGWRLVPPELAAEVAGRGEDEQSLRDKARWYLERGVEIVWLVLPEPREVVVLTAGGDRRYGRGERLAEHVSLPGLTPVVDDFFRQIG